MAVTKVLVANRGEIARRIFRTCRNTGVATVAVYSQPDTGAPHMLEADEAYLLPGAAPGVTYLNIDAVLEAAKASGADAIHPGYGFLAENARFARAVVEAGFIWIGPSPESIEIMGSKLDSKRLMEEAGVPIVPSIPLEGLSAVKSSAAALGYPVLVKASAGGGGKGMRIVDDPDQLTSAIESAKREALTAFGDDTVFLEKYLDAPRHIEIQVFGDKHGNVISLYERECSIQRRHQKIVEETPSPALDDSAREAMSAAARDAALAVEYVGAGTVEFLFQDGEFFFLEMNTRLQVEHPVTEMTTGLDLVQMQINVAEGGRLPPVPPPVTGHAIEARLYAEDPLNDFLPVTGQIHRFDFDETAGLRIDSGVVDGSEVSVHYDPMLAKVIAHGPNRKSAASLLASALRSARIHGSTTNRALLVRILEHPEFLKGETDTHFLERNAVSELAKPLIGEIGEVSAAVAAALSDQALARASAPVLGTLPSGWRNVGLPRQRRSYQGPHGSHDIEYSMAADGFEVDGLGHVTVIDASSDHAVLEIGQTEHHMSVARYGADRYVDSAEGPAHLEELPRFPLPSPDEDAGSLHAPMPGKILKVMVGEGQPVSDGDVLIVIEAMKMEHTLRAPYSGTVSEIRCRVGDQVDADAILAVVEEA